MYAVIPLVYLSDIYYSTDDTFSGEITIYRFNGLQNYSGKCNISMQDPYIYSYIPTCDYIKYESDIAQVRLRPCKFKHNNTWYGGIQIVTNAPGVSIMINGSVSGKNRNALCRGLYPSGATSVYYYDISTESILNQEVYDSLTFDLHYISGHPLNVIYNGNYIGGFEFNLYGGSRDLPGEFYVNPGNCGSCILVLWSGHGSYGNETNAGLLMIRCGYNGDNYEVTEIAKSHCNTYTDAFSISLNANKTFTFTQNSTIVAAVSFKVISNNTAIINNIRSF